MRTMRTAKIAGVAALVAVSVAVSTPANANSNPPGSGSGTGYYGSSIARGETMYAGFWIQRQNNTTGDQVYLVMQDDGNLVEYASFDPQGDGPWHVCWASGTNGSGATHVTYQGDGNFVVYTSDQTPKWASNTVGQAGSTVDMNVDGTIYVGAKPLNAIWCG
jgi:hypothetical protein